jgi:hypothetical protein
MTARKTTTRKKTTARKKTAARKKTKARKKATRKKAPARKKTAARKKTKTRKKATRKKAPGARARRGTAYARFEQELPPNLKEFSRQVRRGLVRLERQLETAQRDARRRWLHLLREVSLQLGRIEAQGQKHWRQQTRKARRDAVRLLRTLEKAIEPPKRRRATAKSRA